MQDLEQLVQQAGIFSGRAQGTNVSSSTTAAVSELRNVQETAAELYRAFGLACRQYTGQQACLRVRADDAKVDHTTFCLPFRRHGSCKASVAQSKRLTLTIESQSSFKLGPAINRSSLSSSKRQMPNRSGQAGAEELELPQKSSKNRSAATTNVFPCPEATYPVSICQEAQHEKTSVFTPDVGRTSFRTSVTSAMSVPTSPK